MAICRENDRKIMKNLCVGILVALGSSACATNSLTVKEQAAPITYKIDGEAGQYASLRQDTGLGDPTANHVRQRPNLTPEQFQQRHIQQPRTQQQPHAQRPRAQRPRTQRPHVSTPRTHAPQTITQAQDQFDPRQVDRQLYAHQSVRQPYEINGKTYTPKHEPFYDDTGLASWYGPKFNGKPTATGEIFDKNDLTAAHKTLPLNSMVHVTNLENGRTLLVRVNDRGPFVDNRIIDLSEASARALGTIHNGLAKVRVRYAGPADTNAPKRFYQEPSTSRTPAPTPQIAARPQSVPAPAPRPVAPAPQPRTDYVPLRDLGSQSPLPPVTQAPQAENVLTPPTPTPAPAPVAQAPIAPVYEIPAPVAPTPSPDRLAPVAPPRPEAGGNVTLTIKGPVHYATQDDSAPQPKWIPTVNRVTTTK